MSSFNSLKTIHLREEEVFYSCLKDEHISDKDYEHAQMVWNTFEVQDLRQHCYLYLKTDVILLADVFEDFRDNYMKSYQLDVGHYFTLAGFTWDAMLTKVILQLLTDLDMLLMIEKGWL